MNKWDVWIADVYFEDDPTQSKQRPVVIVSLEPTVCISLKITSHKKRDCKGEYEIIEWVFAGLNCPSVIRASKICRLKDSDFSRRIGHLHPVDIKNLNNILSILYPKNQNSAPQ